MAFPLLPDGIWQGAASSAAAQEFLERVESWRAATIDAMRGPLPDPALTSEMALFLAAALGDEVHRAPLPRQVRPFPVRPSGGGDPVADAREVAIWRARLIDYLSDVWDVIGPPELDLPECAAAERLLGPAEPGDGPRCPWCLERLRPLPDGSGVAVHDNTCPAARAIAR